MTREEFKAAADDLYRAFRDNADKLLEDLEEMADAWKRKEE